MAMIEPTNDGWIIDADQKRKDMKAFLASMENKNDETAFPFYTKAIKKWPYPYDPSSIESYDELTLSELTEVVIRVKAAFQQFLDDLIERSNVSGSVARDDANGA